MDEIRLSVRGLVEFLLRGGNLDSGSGGNAPERAAEGARIHRRLQKEAGESYRAEVFFSHEEDFEELRFRVEGRADGVFEEDGAVTVDEIKTVSRPLAALPPDGFEVHWAQAKCYAHFLCVRDGLPAAAVRLTYCETESWDLKRLSRVFSAEELAAFFSGLLALYAPWARFQRDWRRTRTASIRDAAFPFPQYRRGQRLFAASVYRALRDGQRLFCQAPTGVGKTISTLFPAVKAMGEGLTSRIFYLTAKTVTRQAASDALALLRGGGLRLKSIVLTAKEKICCLETPECTPQTCPRAAGHFDRVNDALFALLTSGDRFDRETIAAAAERYRVCPFELALDLSEWCDAVICDYNYLFDPLVSLKRYFAEGKTDFVFLIDEAHNLPERGREMYTAELKKSDVLALKREVGDRGKSLSRLLQKLNRAMLDLRPLCGDEGRAELAEPPDAFLKELRAFSQRAEEWLAEHQDSPLRKLFLPLWFSVRFFLRISELYGPEYVTLLSHRGSEVVVRLFCRDASRFLDESMAKGRGAVLFSATLSPLPYFVSVLGGGEDAKTLAVPSPFPPENLLLLTAGHVSTKYADRERSLPEVARLIGAFASARAGNCIAFFPSYDYMEKTAALVAGEYPSLAVVSQGRSMSEDEREAFLLRFSAGGGEPLLGFCVMGGVFSEGVDFAGDRLTGAVIVGVGLPKVCRRQELLREYYESERGEGFAYAYRYPGMNKVMQAAGRVIRSERDRGAVLLIDARFSQPAYRALLPPHWPEPVPVRNEDELAAALRRFWLGNGTNT